MGDAGQPFLPYGRQQLGEEEIEAVVEVLRGDWLTQGPRVEAFEERLCELTGAPHAVAVSSGTAALHLACLAVGLDEGDVAVTTPLTFAATANAALYVGARPEFVDIDDGTWTLSPERLEAWLDESPLAPRARAVLPVHFAGLPANVEAIAELASRRSLAVIEDACHALGASWRDRDGRWHRVGDCSAADAATLSFHPVKHIATGEGGAVLTRHREIADAVRRLRHHGIERDPARLERHPGVWYHEMQDLGFNYRITDIQCALGIVQAHRLEGFVERRREVARWYRELLGGDPRIRIQAVPDGSRPSYHLFVVRVPGRDHVFNLLRQRSIGAQVHYIPVNRHPYYRGLGYDAGATPRAERYADEALSLPMYPALERADVERVAATLVGVLDEAASAREA